MQRQSSMLERRPETFTLDLIPEVAAFAVAMNNKLMARAYKGSWKGMLVKTLFELLELELEELREALATNAISDDVLDESVDVAILSMMVADVKGALKHLPAQL